MKVIYKRDVIGNAPEKWLTQYKHYPDGQVLGWRNKTAGAVRAELDALDINTCSETDIDNAIGTTGWAGMRCDECRAERDVLIRIGDEPDYEARWQELCHQCLLQAVNLCTPVTTGTAK